MRILVFVLGAFALVGCGEKKIPAGDVSGVVTVSGKPLGGGTLKFHPSGGGEPTSATIGIEGTYRVTSLKPGDYQVVVETAYLLKIRELGGDKMLPPKDREKGKATSTPPAPPKEKYPQVNAKYEKLASTPLKITITDGVSKQDFQCD